VLALSAVIFVIPLLVAGICLVRRSRIRRQRPPVSFLEVIRGPKLRPQRTQSQPAGLQAASLDEMS
jgi:hypothetical protein